MKKSILNIKKSILKNPIFKSKSIMATLTLTYVAILLLPIIANLIIILQSVHVIDDEADRRNMEMLTTVQKSIDQRLNEMSSIATQLALNPEITSLAFTNHSDQQQYYEKVRQVIGKANLISSSNTFLDGFYIYLKQPDICITSTTFYEKEKAYNILNSYYDITYKQWNEMLTKANKNMSYFPIKGKQGGVSIAIVQNIPLLDDKVSTGKIVMIVDENTLKQLLPSDNQDTKILLIDKFNNVFASTNELKNDIKLNYDLLQDDKEINNKLQKKDYIVRSVSSGQLDLKYVLLARKVTLSNESLGIIISTITLTSIVLVLASLIIFYSIKKNRTLINNVINSVSAKIGITNHDKDANEYNLIQNMINDAVVLNKNELDVLEKQKLTIRSNLMSRLLKGKASTQMLNSQMESLKIDFHSESFAVIVYYVQSYGNFFDENEQINAQQKSDIITFILNNISEEVAEPNNALLVEVDELRALVVNFDREDQTYQKEILGRIEGVVTKTLTEELNINIIAAASNIHNGYDGLNIAYNEALELMEFKLLTENYDVVQFDETIINRNSFEYSFDMEQRLIGAIKKNMSEEAKSIVLELIKKNIEQNHLPLIISKLFIYDLLSTIVKTIGELTHIEELSELQFFDEILNTTDMATIKKKILALIDVVCERFVETDIVAGSKIIKSVNWYILENYADKNLSVSSISEHLFFSSAYLSRIYKEQTGEGLLSVINKTRIEKARELLDNTHYSIDRIADETGFNSSTVFIRVFKKHVGMTPGKYKEL